MLDLQRIIFFFTFFFIFFLGSCNYFRQFLVYANRNTSENILKVISLHKEQSEIITLAAEGNRHAQQQIYTRHCSRMLGVCRQYVRDLHTAEDVMITAFMKVFTNLNKFENKGSFEGWIRRIVVNECISYIRAQRKVSFLDDVYYTEESFNNIESNLSVDDIQALIDALPDGYKMIFNLYAIEGYKHKEIADLLGISEGTSKSQLSHARAMLQDQINKLKNYENGTN
jgi:RNA polymerase sigma-70 factor (ECF subfamily)